ncbi:MMPL family transporter [Streptomyces antibioticus]|uniref:MMPL family transporter n=1 Tax=Streptomyces antibioticus TaxID=1890 RepID=UPI00224DD609|nr:MMPL family transporter [Streptomyces antibioticus]MCX5171270.1 MMPL family transporter [Streptomyces antibioticus]
MSLTEKDSRAPESGAQPPVVAGVFARVARFSHRRRRLALTLWIIVLVGVWAAASGGDDYRENYSLPGTESQAAADLLNHSSKTTTGDSLQIVLHDEDGLRGADVRGRVDAMLAEVAKLPKVTQVRSLYEDESAVSQDGTIGYATAVLDVTAPNMPREDTERILDTVKEVEGQGLTAELGGGAARKLATGEGGWGEMLGLVFALVILVFMFGTLIAAGLPIVTALFAVGSTLAVIVVASHFVTIADYTPYVMMLVGLGVGIDYALLIFARFRSELVRGATPEEANVKALDSAGRTAFFAGSTVILALLGLVALGLGSLQGMALSVALTVLVTLLASLTLLPALLGVFGDRFARQFRARAAKRAASSRPEEGAAWRRFASGVQRRPLAVLLVAVVALGALAFPALSLRLGFTDAGNDKAGSTSREAYDLLSKGFGPGFNGPLYVVVEGKDGAEAPATAVAAALNDTDGVAAATGPIPTDDPNVATVMAFPTTSPQDEGTSELVGTLRDDVLPRVAEETGARYLVGGATAASEDYSDKVAARMPVFMAIVVGLSLLLLMVVFRSVLIPLKAALLNLLSIGAALGAISLVFQHGMFGVEPGPIEAYLPVVVFAIVFGLSMDYEIFLVSRIQEEWHRAKDPAVAVREGLGHTGSVIIAAGAIMVVVFGSFMLSPERMLQQMGFGMAVAIFVDALVIRCLIVPAVMQLLGRRAWWLPAPLAKVMPGVRLERH